MPPTHGGRYDGGVNDAAAPRATRLGKDEGDEDHRDRDGDTAAPERDPAGACRWLGPSAQRLSVRPRVPSPPDPALSAHPGFPATTLRRGGAGQTARAHCPGVPDRPRRARGGVPAGSAQMPVARCAPRARRTRNLDGRRVGRGTGGGGRFTDGGETTIVINDVRPPRRRHGEHRSALTGCGLTCQHSDHSEAFARDNWNYRAQKSVSRHVGTA